jgi:outer membrane protein assembly factor BamB
MQRLALAVLLVTACRDGGVSPTSSTIRFSPSSLTFDSTVADGQTSRLTVELLNEGRVTLPLTAGQVELPFALEGLPASIPPGPTLVTIAFAPATPGRFVRTITVVSEGGGEATVSIDASAKPKPVCVSATPCVSSDYDLMTRSCVESPRADGTSCDPASACILNATCQAGRCVGEAKRCDDGNACTVDVCNAETGCEVLPRPPCPGDGLCRVGVCDPLMGCGLTDAVDGTGCGQQQTCNAAQVCVSGACVVRDPPDGYRCAEASPCQGEGRCQGDVCVRAEATALVPRWSANTSAETLPDGGSVFRGQHDFVMEPSGDVTLGGFFTTPMTLRANTALARSAPGGPSRRCILWNSRLVCADYPMDPNGRVTALEPSTGETVWTFDVRGQPSILEETRNVFMARLVVQGNDRLAALFEAYPKSPMMSTCRAYYLVILDAQGRLVRAQRVNDPLLDICNHPHPYGVASDAVGNLFIAFSPTISMMAPLRPGTPTLLMSFTHDGVFRWKRTDSTMAGGELAVARGLLYLENSPTAVTAATGEPAFTIAGQLGRVVVSDARMVPAPVASATELVGYEAGQSVVRWRHQLPAGSRFAGEESRLASWRVSSGQRTVALTFVNRDGEADPLALHAVNVHDGSTAFTCSIRLGAATPPQLMEVVDGTLTFMEGALDGNGAASCGKCDPPFAGAAASFHSFSVPLLGGAREPWVGTFGGPGHDHREEVLFGSGGSN